MARARTYAFGVFVDPATLRSEGAGSLEEVRAAAARGRVRQRRQWGNEFFSLRAAAAAAHAGAGAGAEGGREGRRRAVHHRAVSHHCHERYVGLCVRAADAA